MSVTLIEDGGKLYVQRDMAMYSEPTAVRMWWEVSGVAYSPYAVGEERTAPVGELLTPTHTHERGRVQYTTRRANIYLPEGGRTEACRRWEAPIPPPKNAQVRQHAWEGDRGDVFYREERWHKILAKTTKILPVKWDKLKWVETRL